MYEVPCFEVSRPAQEANVHVLQIPILISTHTIDLVRKSIKVWSIEGSLVNIQNDVKRCLFQLEGLKGLNVSKVFSCLVCTFIFARWASGPSEIGFNCVNMLFLATTLPFKFVYSKS